MMPTETLCAMLDERGVEYERNPWSCGTAVWWRDSSGTMWRAHDNEEDDLLSLYAYNSVTPEQAIAATLGRGTCKVEESWYGESEMVEYYCTACDEYIAVEVVKPNGAQPPNYCPNCGRRIVDPTTNDVYAEVCE